MIYNFSIGGINDWLLNFSLVRSDDTINRGYLGGMNIIRRTARDTSWSRDSKTEVLTSDLIFFHNHTNQNH